MSARRIIAVGGGKGGVGKSLVASNLAIALAQAGARTVLIDADLGSANQHTLFGVDGIGPHLGSFIARDIDSLEEAMVSLPIPGLTLIQGCGAIPGSANLAHAQKQKFIRHVRGLNADAVVIDVGAGIAFNVVDLFTVADIRVVVMLPQLTSFQNAYAFLKAAIYRVMREAARLVRRHDLLDELGPARETDRLEHTLQRLAEIDVNLVEMIRARLTAFGAHLLGNQILGARDRSTLAAVSRMVEDYLGVSMTLLGHLRHNPTLRDSVNARRPLLLSHPQDDCALVLKRTASRLLELDVEKMRQERTASDRTPFAPPEQDNVDDADLAEEINDLLAMGSR